MIQALIPQAGRFGFAGRLLFLGSLLLLLPLLVSTQALGADTQQVQPIQVPNPAADLWREVRQRDLPARGDTQVKGVDTGVLINANGEKWRQFRMQQLIPYAGYLLAGMLLLLALFYLIRGKIRIQSGVSDKKLFRYSLYERTIHWSIASLFLILALTGLAVLFGRSLLLPLMGQEAFSVLASLSKDVHNLLGPVFAVALLLIFIRFVRRNIYQRGDLSWLLRGGGIIGKKHVPSNFFNMGEKSMFWILVLAGSLIVASGILLLFPSLGQSRIMMELSHVAHGITTLLMMLVILGHIYIGSVGMEGALDGMTTGYCDLNWAREHHEQWAELCETEGQVLTADEVARRRGEAASGSSVPTQESGA